MENKICVTRSDYTRIMNVIGTTPEAPAPAGMAGLLLQELKHARMVASDLIPGDVITMNSRVLVRELSSGRGTEITVSYPADADRMNGRISVLSPVGIALLGCREGHVARWKTPSGIGEFRIEKIVYQPEAAGHYHL